MSQTALFDLDGLVRQSRADQLRAEFEAGPGRGLVARSRYAYVARVAYRAARGSNMGIRPRMAEFAPHPVFDIGLCQPGRRLIGADDEWEEPAGTPHCSLTIMDRDLRVPFDRDERPHHGPGDLMSLPVCLGCDWEGTEANDEDVAVADGLDHCWPGWRAVPALDRPGGGGITQADLSKPWWRTHVEVCERLVPSWEANGYPLLTIRTAPGTRSHDSQVMGRWDIWSGIAKTGAGR